MTTKQEIQREISFLNQGEVNLDVHTQLKNDLNNKEKITEIRNNPSIHKTIIIIALNLTVENKIRASDVDWKIISLQMVQNWTLRMREFTGTRKALKHLKTSIPMCKIDIF